MRKPPLNAICTARVPRISSSSSYNRNETMRDVEQRRPTRYRAA